MAALFVRPDSIYKTFPGVDCYDIERDARTWPGGSPVIVHPPCRTWGCLKAFATAAPAHEHTLALWAINQVRRWGGVLEHPKGSTLFRECGCVIGGLPDKWGGWILEVDQFRWGHKARKRTLLYIVGTRDLPPVPCRDGEPTHVIDRPGRTRKTERPNSAEKKPACSHKDREATPLDFAKWLVELARRCSKHNRRLKVPLCRSSASSKTGFDGGFLCHKSVVKGVTKAP